MIKLQFSISFFLCCLSLFSFGQSQPYLSESWTGSGGQMTVFSKNSTVTDAMLNVYVAGSTVNSNNNNDILVQKFDPYGTLLWAQSFNGLADMNDMAAAIYVDNNYNVYVTGTSIKTAWGQ